MFMVAPRGRLKLATLDRTLSLSVAQLIVTGSVAALERVLKAISQASRIPRHRASGPSLPSRRAIAAA